LIVKRIYGDLGLLAAVMESDAEIVQSKHPRKMAASPAQIVYMRKMCVIILLQHTNAILDKLVKKVHL